MNKKKITIVGGGASGMIAAIFAARKGMSVTIIEKEKTLGKKLKATGNGRCNFTNLNMDPSFYNGGSTYFIEKILESFSPKDIINFYEGLGMISKSRDGYIYPYSDEAKTVLYVLDDELRRLGVRVLLSEELKGIRKNKNGFTLEVSSGLINTDSLIISAGSRAGAAGSDGKIYAMLKQLGHNIIPFRPALTAVRCLGKYYKKMAGVRTKAKLSVYIEGKHIVSDEGELQLTDYGISGIPTFQISRFVGEGLANNKKTIVYINFMPGYEFKDFYEMLLKRRDLIGYKNSEDFLLGLFNSKLNLVFIELANIDKKKKVRDISDSEIKRLAGNIIRYEARPSMLNPFKNAQLSSGGVDTLEINPSTMESKILPGLFMTGEVIDIDGRCGGYNLHFAFLTGRLAGLNV